MTKYLYPADYSDYYYDDERDVQKKDFTSKQGRKTSVGRSDRLDYHDLSPDFTSPSLNFDSFPFDVEDSVKSAQNRMNSRSSIPPMKFNFPSLPSFPSATEISQNFNSPSKTEKSAFGLRSSDLGNQKTSEREDGAFYELMKTKKVINDSTDKSKQIKSNQPTTPRYVITNDYNYVDNSRRDVTSNTNLNPVYKNDYSDRRISIGSQKPSKEKVGHQSPTSTSSISFGRVSSREEHSTLNPTIILDSNENDDYNIKPSVKNKLGHESKQSSSHLTTFNDNSNSKNKYNFEQNLRVTPAISIIRDIEHDNSKPKLTYEVRKPVPPRIDNAPRYQSAIRRPIYIDTEKNLFKSKPLDHFQPDKIVFEDDFIPIMTPQSPGPPHLLSQSLDKVKFDQTDSRHEERNQYTSSQQRTIPNVREEHDNFKRIYLDDPSKINPSQNMAFLHPQTIPKFHTHQSKFNKHQGGIILGEEQSNRKQIMPVQHSPINTKYPQPKIHRHNIFHQNQPMNVHSSPHINSLRNSQLPVNIHTQPNTLSKFRINFPKHQNNVHHNFLHSPQIRQGHHQELVHGHRIRGPHLHGQVPQNIPLSRHRLGPQITEVVLPDIHTLHHNPSKFQNTFGLQDMTFNRNSPDATLLLSRADDFNFIRNQRDSATDFSTHFKSPHDPPHSFSVHHLPPNNNLITPGNSQRLPGPFLGQPIVSGALPIDFSPPHRPLRNRRPGGASFRGPGRPRGRPGGRRPPHGFRGGPNGRHRHGTGGPRRSVIPGVNGVRRHDVGIEFQQQLISIDPMLTQASEHMPKNLSILSSSSIVTSQGTPININSNKDQNSIPETIAEASSHLPKQSSTNITPQRRGPGAANVGQSFLKNIWTTLTGSKITTINSSNANMNNAPKPKPRMTQ